MVGLGVGGLILIGLIALRIRSESATYQTFKQLQNKLPPLETEEQYASALKEYEAFRHGLSFYTLYTRFPLKREIQRLQVKLREIEQQGRLNEIDQEARLLKLFRTALEAEKTADSFKRPLELYQTIMVECQKKNYAKNLLEDTRARIEVISQYLKEARLLYEKAYQLDKEGKIEEARQLLFQLINNYPKSELVPAAKIPVRIESTPAGARVYLNNQAIGVTPLKVYLPLRESTRLVVQYKGFRSYEQMIKGYERPLIKVTFEKHPVWTYATGGIIEGAPAVCQNIVYVGSRDGNLYALDILSGRLLWRFTTDSKSEIVTAPILDPPRGRLFITSLDKDLYIMNLAAGSLIQRARIEGAVRIAPTLSSDGQRIFLGGTDRMFYCLESGSGKLIWKFEMDSKIRAGSTISGETLYVPSEDGTLYILNAKTGNLLGKLKISDELVSQPLVRNNTCYLGSSDTNLYALNLIDRTIKWRYKTRGNISGVVALGKGMILATSTDGFGYALDEATGALRWKFQAKGPINAPPVVAPEGTIYLSTGEGIIYALAPDGKEIWQYKTGGKIVISPALSEQFVFITSERNIYTLER